MTASQLAASLRTAGLTIRELPGWATRGFTWTTGQPIGIVHHHTAPPVPYPPERLITDGRIKANMNTKPDGTVWMIAYRACNFSSGQGSSVVLNETRNRIIPVGTALSRNLIDNTGGNAWYWNFENDHPGDGSPLPRVQYDAILTATRVVLDHFTLEPSQVVAHAEWTRRKIDPRWDGLNAHEALNRIRSDLDRKDDDMWTKGLDENGWRALARNGIAAGGEAAVVDYWWTKRAQRSDEEHRKASANMIVALSDKAALPGPPGKDGRDGADGRDGPPGKDGLSDADVRAIMNQATIEGRVVV